MTATATEHDGHRLLRAVMRSRSRDNNAKQPLADWLYDHLPTALDEVYEVRVRFRVRYGVVRITRVMWLDYLKKEFFGFKIETFHDRGRGVRGVTWHAVDGDQTIETILNALNSFH